MLARRVDRGGRGHASARTDETSPRVAQARAAGFTAPIRPSAVLGTASWIESEIAGGAAQCRLPRVDRLCLAHP